MLTMKRLMLLHELLWREGGWDNEELGLFLHYSNNMHTDRSRDVHAKFPAVLIIYAHFSHGSTFERKNIRSI